MNRVIALLHGIDTTAAGLADFGRPGNYFARQIGRWSKQYRLGDRAHRRHGQADRLAARARSARRRDHDRPRDFRMNT
jgi:aminoglycoside phosphotransferase (APT) family kinase protein